MGASRNASYSLSACSNHRGDHPNARQGLPHYSPAAFFDLCIRLTWPLRSRIAASTSSSPVLCSSRLAVSNTSAFVMRVADIC